MANATQILPFSASVRGLAIKITATASPGTLIHTGAIQANLIDRYTLQLVNSDAIDHIAAVEFGGTLPEQQIIVNVPANSGVYPVIAGNILLGSGAIALSTRVFADAADVVSCLGWVMRVTP
jgi:hypothetical protein